MSTSLNGDVKSIPIRCVIEEKLDHQSCLVSSGVPVKPESFAIVPSNTLFKDVVKTVLLKLGYSTNEALSAKGEVQIKKWKPLDLNSVSENEQASVEDMLGDLANIATLRIKIRPRSDDVKDKLLLMLLRQPYDALASKGFPISKDIVEGIVTGQDNLSEKLLKEFYLWYDKHINSPEGDLGEQRSASASKTAVGVSAGSNKSRLRVSFNHAEAAKLQEWFEIDAQPSKQTMNRYLAELNEASPRGNGFKLDLTNIMYWFKNARAAVRRNGRSTTSEDLSEDEGHIEKEIATVPPLPNSNAVYVIKNPIVGEDSDEKKGEPQTTRGVAEESDMEEELSVTDDESEMNDKDTPNELTGSSDVKTDNKKDEDDQLESQIRVPSATSSPQMHSNFVPNVAPRIPGYPFTYGAFPMAYLQSTAMQNSFYKEWNEKMQSAAAVVQAQQVNSVQQNLALLKADSLKVDCELSKAERQKRHRAFIDPVSEIPKLEQWFEKETHPSHYVIEQICDDLNRGEFRSRYPKLSPKNIQLWFKNHRAKVKRMRVGGSGINYNDLDSSQIKMSPPHLAVQMM